MVKEIIIERHRTRNIFKIRKPRDILCPNCFNGTFYHHDLGRIRCSECGWVGTLEQCILKEG